MSYAYVVLPDPEQGIDVTNDTIRFAVGDNQLAGIVREVGGRYPNHTICVYKLSNMFKIKSKPVYAKYNVLPTGEVVPE